MRPCSRSVRLFLAYFTLSLTRPLITYILYWLVPTELFRVNATLQNLKKRGKLNKLKNRLFFVLNRRLFSSDTLDVMVRQLTDDCSIQEIAQQQIRLSRFRAIKASLFRCMKDGAGQAVDCYVRQLLVAIAAFFRSLLRSSHSAAEQLNSEFSA